MGRAKEYELGFSCVAHLYVLNFIQQCEVLNADYHDHQDIKGLSLSIMKSSLSAFGQFV